MLRRFRSLPSSTSSSALSLRFCSSSSASSASETKPKFDPVEFAKEQERRRQTEPRKAFWTASGSTNVKAEIQQLEKQREALMEKERQARLQQEEESKQRQVWGRDTIELVENMQQASSQTSSRPLAGKKSTTSTGQDSSAAGKNIGGGGGGAAKEYLSKIASGQRPTPLTSRLDSLYKNYVGKDTKSKEAEEAILKRRKEQLKWREIDYQLDQVRLERDFLQWYYYIKYGKDYAIDCELERELRYFPEHVAKELKTNLKFLVGSSKLIKTGPAFPTMQKLTKFQTVLDRAKGETKKGYEEDLLLSTSFNKPTLVFMSQLAHGSENVEDLDQYYVPLLREALANPHSPPSSNLGKGPVSKKSTSASSNSSNSDKKKNPLESDTANNNASENSTKPEPQKCSARDVPSILSEVTTDSKFQGKFDFCYLKTADFQSSIWMRKWLTKVHATRINAVLAPRTYVGVRLLRNFSATLGLRNYSAQYVFLVDHTGKIRWVSTGPPTPEEVEWFTEHCRTLMKLHVVAKAK